MNNLLEQTRQVVQTHLEAARDLSILRHSLNDELSELSNDLISLNYNEDRQPLLLEDLETFHRNLKELTSVKQYVQVIEHALKLRCVVVFFFPTCLSRIPM